MSADSHSSAAGLSSGLDHLWSRIWHEKLQVSEASAMFMILLELVVMQL